MLWHVNVSATDLYVNGILIFSFVSAFGVEDLSSNILQIQAKKFYLDVKQNKRGRFIKISEVLLFYSFILLNSF